ncbi:MAG: hypothetical protein COW84_06650 [Gammaproteobacteria bacterium CG22_combo_CG10-13_8_21_14_all_40_8]|nr:MAG: hypothetical protein COW84_06650 [Gammaproteobacteria bacterium CG22_combo_CG10-13_8_21_14_all_40_8]
MKQNNGYTLLELMIALAIISVLLGQGIPSYQAAVIRSKVSSQLNELTDLLNLARIYAISRNVVTTICPSADGKSCSRDWTQGIMLFRDENLNHTKDLHENIIKILPKLPNSHLLTWRAFQNKNYLQYSPSGFTRSQNGTFRHCVTGETLKYNRALIITVSGRVRMSQDKNKDGIYEDRKGEPIKCG